MPRPARIHYPGAVFHVVARGIEKSRIFTDKQDYQTILKHTNLVRVQENAKLLAFALMPNHLHFLIRVMSASLSKIMQRILTRYSIYFNKRHNRVGHLFQGRFNPYLCTNDSYFSTLIRYIHQNPLRAGLEPEVGQWPWTSHREYMGLTPPTHIDVNYGLSFFGKDITHARNRYLELVGERVHRDEIENDSIIPIQAETMPLQRILDPIAIPLEEIAADVARVEGVEEGLIFSGSRRRIIVGAKREFALQAVRSGHPTRDIAQYLKCTLSNVCRLLDMSTPRKQLE